MADNGNQVLDLTERNKDKPVFHISTHVESVLNETFGEDIDNLMHVERILEEYKTKEDVLAKAIEESEKQTCDHLCKIISSCEITLQEIEALSDQINDIISQHGSHTEKCSQMESEMKAMKSKVEEIENEQIYILWLKEIQTLSRDVDVQIQKKNMAGAITSYNQLHAISKTLQGTTCVNMKSFINDTCLRLFDALKDTLSKELNSLLLAIKYPFPTGISSPHFNKKDETEEQLKKIVGLLAKLKPLHCEEENSCSLITEHLAEPLKKRFYFHFYGDRHTNNPEKPEWYFTQVLNWIKDHAAFLVDYIVPIVEANQSSPLQLEASKGDESVVTCGVKKEFERILVDLVEEKLVDTIDVVRTNDVMVAHLIDETILFEKELKECVEANLGCLHILLREDFLHLWLRLEEKFTFEWMNLKLEDPDAWVPKFSELATNDKNLIYYAPKCVEEFVTFLTLMNSRHKGLCNVNAQCKFLNLLVKSMEAFVRKMSDLSCGGASMQPLSHNYCALVNGACYMAQVLEEWSEDIYFVQIMSEDANSTEDGIGDDGTVESIFRNVLDALENLIASCAEAIVRNLKSGVKIKLYSYKSETWQSLPPLKDYIKPSLSSGACDMMVYIKEHLHMLEERLCPDIFERVWKQLTTMLDQIIFSEIVYQSHFNEGGANQLQFDLKENLFVLFSQYTTRPESYFKLLKDSCTLLNLSTGTAYLLKELLQQQKSKEEVESDVVASLKEVGVCCLTSFQAGRLINSRIDYWPVVS